MLDGIWQDLKHGARMLAKNPGFALVAMLSIAVGVGANAAMFSVADGLALRPLPVPRPNEVLTIAATAPQLTRPLGVSYRDYVDLRDRSRSFTGLSAHRVIVSSFANRQDEPAQSKLGFAVTGNFFEVMQVTPELGRFFRRDEDQVPGRDAVVVLGHDAWVNEFNSDPAIIDRRIRLAGQTFTVIGVAPASFPSPELVLPGVFYVPMAMLPTLDGAGGNALEDRAARSLSVKGRLTPGTSVAQAREDVRVIGHTLDQAHPDTNKGWGLLAQTHLEARRAERGSAAFTSVGLLMTLAVAVLLVACANVAGMLLSQAPARAREIALRLAIGSGRVRIVRQLVTETCLLAAGGGALGLALGYAALTFLLRLDVVSDIGVKIALTLDRRALAVGVVVAAASTLFAGLLPAWRAAQATDLAGTLRNTTAAPRRTRLWGRHGLVVGQVALSLVLLTIAVSVYRGFRTQLAAGPGFRTDHILLVNLDPRLARYDKARADAFYAQLKERARALPGVTSVGMTTFVPMNQDNRISLPLEPEGSRGQGTELPVVQLASIDDGYLRTLGVALVAGRDVLPSDTAATPRVALVNQAFVARYWPEQNPIGKRVRLGTNAPWIEVVGVTVNSRSNFVAETPGPLLYLPDLQGPSIRSTLLIATSGDSAALASPVRAIVGAIDPNLPVSGIWTMEEFYRGNAVLIADVIVRIVSSMGSMGLALAMVGLYGLVAYSVSRRTREIGLRMAVGAHPASVLRMVLRHGLGLALAGAAIGTAGSLAVGRLLGAALPDAFGIDLVTYLLVVPLLLAVVLIAAYLPARRASRIDPLIALRQE